MAELAFELRMDGRRLSSLVASARDPVPSNPPPPDRPSSVYFLADVVAKLREDDTKRRAKEMSSNAKSRAELARAVKLELSNEEVAGNLTPVDDAVEKEAQIAGMAARSLDAIDMRVRRRHPETPPEILATIREEIARAQNMLVDRIESLDEDALDKEIAEHRARGHLEAEEEIADEQREEPDLQENATPPSSASSIDFAEWF